MRCNQQRPRTRQRGYLRIPPVSIIRLASTIDSCGLSRPCNESNSHAPNCRLPFASQDVLRSRAFRIEHDMPPTSDDAVAASLTSIQSELVFMQLRHSIDRECWRHPGEKTAKESYMRRHRARHRHVGDVRFALFVVFMLGLAYGIASRSEAAPVNSPTTANVVPGCTRTLGSHTRGDSSKAPSTTERIRADAIFLEQTRAKPQATAAARSPNESCLAFPAAAAILSRNL